MFTFVANMVFIVLYISNLGAKCLGLNLDEKLSNMLGNHEALN